MSFKTLLLAAGLAAAAVSGAHAQDWTRPAAFGGTELRAGFSPDPHQRNLTAGGSIAASSRFSNCNGFIANAPDYSVSYQAGSLPLIFSVDSDRDTTLIINDPNGSWWCDDDGARSALNPMLRFDQPVSGRYDVWVGTYSQGAGVPATLFISELDEYTRSSTYSPPRNTNTGGLIEANTGSIGAGQNSGGAYSSGPDWRLAPTYQTLSLNAGFANDPRSISLTAGGGNSASDFPGGTCYGNIAGAPDVTLSYSAGSLPLYLTADSQSDTTLVVRAPDGLWYCDDDGAEASLNPLVWWDAPRSGEYDIWVGTFGDTPAPATLYISELGEPDLGGAGGSYNGGSSVDIFAPARAGTVALNGGFLPDPESRFVLAGGSIQASSAINSSCRGYITREPTLELRYDGSSSLYIYTTGSSDTTLAINTPNGDWVCDDDGASGASAALSFSGGASGTYDIYVGTYGSGQANTTLNISELGVDW